MESYIQKSYQDYKKFMNQSNLPDIMPIFNTQNDKLNYALSYINDEDMRKNTVPIYFSNKLFEYHKQYYNSILFHEFTHILDANITFKKIYDDNERSKLMLSYSEYHAAQIELISYLGYSNIESMNRKFDINTKIYFQKELLDIENYLIYPLADATAILNKDRFAYALLNSSEYNKKYIKMKVNLMYYLGKYCVCENYANRKPHNFFHEFGFFQEDVKHIYDSLKSENYVEIIKNINAFELQYLTYFKFS